MTAIDHPDNTSPVVAGNLQLLSTNTGPVANGNVFVGPAVDVTSFAQVLVQIQASTGGPSTYSVFFTGTPLGGQIGPTVAYPSNSTAQASIMVDPTSAYLFINVANNSGGTQSYTVAVYGQTEHQNVALVVPPTSFVFNTASLGAGLFATSAAFAMPAGIGYLYVRGVGGAAQAFLQQWSGSAWQDIAGLTTPAVGPATQDVLIPLGDSRLITGNPTAAAQAVEAALVATV